MLVITVENMISKHSKPLSHLPLRVFSTKPWFVASHQPPSGTEQKNTLQKKAPTKGALTAVKAVFASVGVGLFPHQPPSEYFLLSLRCFLLH